MPLFCCCASGVGPPLVFTYTVTGAEVGFGTNDLTVPIPGPARADTNYTASVANGRKQWNGVNPATVAMEADVATYTVNSFGVHSAQPAAVGDKINVTIAEKTA